MSLKQHFKPFCIHKNPYFCAFRAVQIVRAIKWFEMLLERPYFFGQDFDRTQRLFCIHCSLLEQHLYPLCSFTIFPAPNFSYTAKMFFWPSVKIDTNINFFFMSSGTCSLSNTPLYPNTLCARQHPLCQNFMTYIKLSIPVPFWSSTSCCCLNFLTPVIVRGRVGGFSNSTTNLLNQERIIKKLPNQGALRSIFSNMMSHTDSNQEDLCTPIGSRRFISEFSNTELIPDFTTEK